MPGEWFLWSWTERTSDDTDYLNRNKNKKIDTCLSLLRIWNWLSQDAYVRMGDSVLQVHTQKFCRRQLHDDFIGNKTVFKLKYNEFVICYFYATFNASYANNLVESNIGNDELFELIIIGNSVQPNITASQSCESL